MKIREVVFKSRECILGCYRVLEEFEIDMQTPVYSDQTMEELFRLSIQRRQHKLRLCGGSQMGSRRSTRKSRREEKVSSTGVNNIEVPNAARQVQARGKIDKQNIYMLEVLT